MPVHDWTRIYAGAFHDFHTEWLIAIKHALGRGLLPPDYYAMVDQVAGGWGPDVLALQRPTGLPPARANGNSAVPKGGTLAVAQRPPKTRFHITDEPRWYASKQKAVVVRHVTGHRIVAVLEIVSGGNKDSKSAFEMFVRKAQELIYGGIHLALVDLYPPTRRDPEGIHPAVWGDDDADTFRFDKRKPLTCASYVGGPGAQAFVEPVAIGDALPDLPVFLTPFEYVEVPLERTYAAAFDALPDYWQDVMNAAAKRK